MDSTYIESKTAHKTGWGSARWRRVSGLTPEERQAVRTGNTVWFAFRPWHYTQSGYKVVTMYGDTFDSREPTPTELAAITVECPECERDLGPEAVTCPTCSGGDNWETGPVQTDDF